MKNTININFGDALFEKFCNGICCSECIMNSILDENGDCKGFFQEQLIKNDIKTNIVMDIM